MGRAWRTSSGISPSYSDAAPPSRTKRPHAPTNDGAYSGHSTIRIRTACADAEMCDLAARSRRHLGGISAGSRLERRDAEARDDGGDGAGEEHERHAVVQHELRPGELEEEALEELVACADIRRDWGPGLGTGRCRRDVCVRARLGTR